MAFSPVQLLNGQRMARIPRLAKTNDRNRRFKTSAIKIDALNLGSMTGKGRELMSKIEREQDKKSWRRI